MKSPLPLVVYPPSTTELTVHIENERELMLLALEFGQGGYSARASEILGQAWARAEKFYDARERALRRWARGRFRGMLRT